MKITVKPKPSFESVLKEWKKQPRRVGCVAAAQWWANRLPQFKLLRRNYYTENGDLYQRGHNGRCYRDSPISV